MGDCDDDWVLVDSPSASQPPAPRPTTGNNSHNSDDDLDSDLVIVGRNPATAAGTPPEEDAPAASSWRQRLAAALTHTAASASSLFPADTAPTVSPTTNAAFSLNHEPVLTAADVAGPPREGYATPAYRAQWGAASDALAAAWRGVPLPQTAAACRGAAGILVRRGVPDALRRRVWMAAAGVGEYCARHPHAFEHALAATFGPRGVPAAIGAYPLFGARALPAAPMCLAPAGVHAAKAVLCMVATRHAELLCCPRLPAVVLLLLHFMDLQDAFLTIEAMLEPAIVATASSASASASVSGMQGNCGGSGTTFGTNRSLNGSLDDPSTTWGVPYFETSPGDAVQVGLALAEAIGPVAGRSVARAADRLRVDVAGALAPALLDRVFAGTLPFGLVVRVADCFLTEGRGVLARVALALVAQYRAVLAAAPSAGDFFRRLEQAALQQPVFDAPLLKAAFRLKIPSSLSVLSSFCSSSSSSSSSISSSSSSFSNASAASALEAENALCQQVYYRPKMAEESRVLRDPLLLETLWGLVPRPLAITDPVLVYEAERDGFNLRRLLEAAAATAPCLVLARTAAGAVAGFYAAAPLGDALTRPRGHAFGDGETFVFTLAPAARKYPWAEDAPHSNTAFLVYDELGTLHVGAGRRGAALSLSEDLQVESNPCDTFASPPLFQAPPEGDGGDASDAGKATGKGTSTSPASVVCTSLEVFGFD